MPGAAPGGNEDTGCPLVHLCHPAWTEENRYEDIPIMVFTPARWGRIQKRDLIVSAAGSDQWTAPHAAAYASGSLQVLRDQSTPSVLGRD